MIGWRLMGALMLACGSACGAAEPPARVRFDRDIQPLLARCLVCHGAAKARGGLRLDSRQAAIAPLDSGNKAIVPGHPDKSELLRRVTSPDAGVRMPPRGEALNAGQVSLLRQWIADGAEWPAHWAYRPLVKPPQSHSVGPQSWAQGPIDLYIREKQADRGLSPAPPADKRTLLRRVTFDLIGLPPTASELTSFLADDAPNAYERIVDRLLASPHYGERWARHWMDVAHFAETHGHDQDRPREHAWPYRDYLIRAFNQDMPYAQFVQEQVAGEVLFPDDPWALVATGFLAAGPWDESSLRDIREDSLDREIGRYLDRDDIVSTVMSTFVSTTVHCARCHDHKFDPITQQEYYGLQAVFAGTDKANRAYDPDPRIANRRQQLTEQRAKLGRQLEEVETSLRSSPRTPRDLKAISLRRELDRDLSQLPEQSLVYCGTSQFVPDGSFRPTPALRPVYLLRRGDVRNPVSEAAPGALSCVTGLDSRLAPGDLTNEGRRRAALARWLSHPDNGLAWRSIANRIWQYHFGHGLVETANDFGRMGAAPTHPELLDWLAATLRETGGSIKNLHRLIVTSATYRQSSQHNPKLAELDGDNRLLWRMNRQRLDAESIHDAVLQISGKLDTRMGGPSGKQFIQKPGIHVTPLVDYAGFEVDNPVNYRRSVYRFLFRTLPDPLMEALDCPDGSQSAPMRGASVTALQALALLHDKFIVRQCEQIARLAAQDRPVLEQQVSQAYLLILGRSPSAKESQMVAAYARKHGLANACRFLLNSNEFVFLD